VIGIGNNINYTRFLDFGYLIEYNQFYSHETVSNEIDTISAKCNSTSILCIGGSDVVTNLLLVVACGNCQKITKVTSSVSVAYFDTTAFWYRVPGSSIGFSPTLTIDLSPDGDTFDNANNQRVSWVLDRANQGGLRLGAHINLRSSNLYNKMIFLL